MSAKPRGLAAVRPLSTVSMRDLTSSPCFLSVSCSMMRSAACCCMVAPRKLLADVMAALSELIGSSTLEDMLSDILSAIDDEIASSDNSRSRWATDLIATFASAGNLKDKAAENKMLASFSARISSLLSSHPFFSSQTRESLAEETGLGEAAIWASRSDQGVKSRFAGDATLLLLVLWEELRTWGVLDFVESPIMEQFDGRWGVIEWSGSAEQDRKGVEGRN